ncbi:hypothetical protein NHX12_011795 [Muraenolepis orangiensis]|uniref:Formin FH3 domain-containing protein n=1 Tax=Muraenolepis orangiensis TaxID=630683 RepID=A0A9Q0DH26_9TELE|nr:hypothetical protein NHX12_011795 [Muraenolepis orangiensis]
MTIAAERNNKERFAPIVEGLENHEAQQLQVACMQLINALVTSPDDLDFRIHLRNEFLRCGLKKILPYYKILEECVAQVVLHRSGMDPDFGYSRRLDVDFTHLIDQCVDKAKVEESEEKASEFSKKFDEEFGARQEAQADSQKKEERIKELEGQIQALQTQLTNERDNLTEAQRLIRDCEAKVGVLFPACRTPFCIVVYVQRLLH